jgi:hypothetical protein
MDYTNWVFSFLSKEDMEKYHNSSLFYDACSLI